MNQSIIIKQTTAAIALLAAVILMFGFLSQGGAITAQDVATTVLPEMPSEPTTTPDFDYVRLREHALEVAQFYGLDEVTEEITAESTLGVWYAITGQSLGVEEDPYTKVYVIQFVGSGKNVRSGVPLTQFTIVMDIERGYAITGTSMSLDLDVEIAKNLAPVLVPPATPSTGLFPVTDITPTPISDEE